MKVTLNIDEELQPALEHHLETGIPVQVYIKSALRYFNTMLIAEKTGSKCGYGDSSRFKNYNTEISPTLYLLNQNNGE
jgi:hypothetical protein